MDTGVSPRAARRSCSRCMRCRACSGPSSSRRCAAPATPVSLPRDPAHTPAAHQSRLAAAQAPRLGGLCQDAAGRPRDGVGLPVSLHAPRGRLQRAHRRPRCQGGAPARAHRPSRRQTNASSSTGPASSQRFLQHVLPPGFKRIRHYGLLSAAAKSERLAQARAGPGHADARHPGVRRRGRISPARDGHRALVLPALPLGALANRAGLATRARQPRTGRARMPGATVNRSPCLILREPAPSPQSRRWCGLWPRPRFQDPRTLQRASPVLEPRIDHHRSRLAHLAPPHRRAVRTTATAPEPYIAQQPRTPAPSGGSVHRRLSDAIGIGALGQRRLGVR